MFTAAGAPQAATLIRQLRNNGDCATRLIALDMNEEVIGRYWADAFYRIPQAGGPGYVERIKEIIAAEKPDALLNVSENDVPPLAAISAEIEAMGTKFIGPSAEAVAVLTNKRKLYDRFRDVPGVKVPEYATPTTLQEFVDTAHAMGYPNRDLCFKPHQSKGTRGFRILTEKFSKRDLLLNHKPTARYMSLGEFVSIFEGDPDFPQLLLMEVVAGEEVDCMAVAYEGEALLCTVKSRESHRWGVIDRGELISRPEIVETMEVITRESGPLLQHPLSVHRRPFDRDGPAHQHLYFCRWLYRAVDRDQAGHRDDDAGRGQGASFDRFHTAAAWFATWIRFSWRRTEAGRADLRERMMRSIDCPEFLYLDVEGGWGGSSRSLYYLVRSMDRRSFRPVVISRKEGPNKERYGELGVEYQYVPQLPSFRPADRKNLISLAIFVCALVAPVASLPTPEADCAEAQYPADPCQS